MWASTNPPSMANPLYLKPVCNQPILTFSSSQPQGRARPGGAVASSKTLFRPDPRHPSTAGNQTCLHTPHPYYLLVMISESSFQVSFIKPFSLSHRLRAVNPSPLKRSAELECHEPLEAMLSFTKRRRSQAHLLLQATQAITQIEFIKRQIATNWHLFHVRQAVRSKPSARIPFRARRHTNLLTVTSCDARNPSNCDK